MRTSKANNRYFFYFEPFVSIDVFKATFAFLHCFPFERIVSAFRFLNTYNTTAKKYPMLMIAPRPTFQQFVDFLWRTDVLLWSLPSFLCFSKILLFLSERIQRPLATVLDPLSYLFKPIWQNTKFWNHQWWRSSNTKCEGYNYYHSWFQIWLILGLSTWQFYGPTGKTQGKIQASAISSW